MDINNANFHNRLADINIETKGNLIIVSTTEHLFELTTIIKKYYIGASNKDEILLETEDFIEITNFLNNYKGNNGD